jgi:acyl-homoserine lactone acylase PvdQ
MFRRALALLAITGLISASLASGVGLAQAGPPAVEDPMKAFSITPPGQHGEITAAQFAAGQASGDFGDHYADLLPIYASLINDDDVAEDELGKYFHPMQFGPGADAGAPYSPIEGVTVYRDKYGIPSIYAPDSNKASFALGYVTAEDRMFEMDAFRHAARGTLAAFIGAGDNDANLKMDIATRREGYTDDEVQAMFDNLDDKFGKYGKAVQDGLQAYSDGINARIGEIQMNPSLCSVEYQAIGQPCPGDPAAWEPLDTLYLVILQLRIFGETAGGEIQNAGLYAHLTKKHGPKVGTKIYNDLMRVNDPLSPTSIEPTQAKFPSQNLGKMNPKSIAIPDDAEKIATQENRRSELRTSVLRGLGFPTGPQSNAILVSGAESASGNPIQWGAPQVGYATPGFFMEVDVHTPDADFRGPAVPGASALIPLGRGTDYAWSLTTGYSDAVDTRVEKLCEPDGGEPKEDSNGYLFKGKCEKMLSWEETFTIGNNPTAQDPPRQAEKRTFQRTRHGPVFARGKVSGAPVAFVKQRFFWKKEIDSIPQFYRWNTAVHSIKDFEAAAKKFTMSFNAFYADSENIGYFHVGMYPKRTPGTHTSLPTWGTGEWEWKGRFPYSAHPHVVNPKIGWLTNWNNKPSLGWNNYDNAKWGAVHRVQLLKDGMHALLDGNGKATMSDVVDVARVAATQDTRGVYVGPEMLEMARSEGKGGPADEATALTALQTWIDAGANRFNKNADAEMDDGPALALFDAWYDKLVHKIFDDELGPEGYTLIPAPVTDYTPDSGSSFWFDFSSYLENLFDADGSKPYSRDYCDDMTTADVKETCAAMVLKSFQDAYAALKTDQGADMTKWTMPAENIVFAEFGAGSVDPIPWQNRGTHNHIVEITGKAGE